jgi:hypothetical protein
MSGITNEMRKKSHVTVQKWISVTEDEKNNCDSNELNINEPSTSGGSGASVKGKISEICNKFNVNEKLKSKKIELKNLITKTTQKIKRESSKEDKTHHNMDQNQQMDDTESRNKQCDNEIEQIKDDVNDTINSESNNNDRGDNEDSLANEESEEVTNEEEIKSEPNKLTPQRCHISVLGRSSSENPNPRTRRLRDIGRSFSVANDGELPNDSTDNLIYDDEDISIINPSFNTSPSVLSNKTNSNNQLDKNLASLLRPSLGHMRPLREHTVSEGHSSPHVVPKNPLLRDGSFQSDSSHCSSVESLLEARKPDAEAILVNLGFGPVQGSDDVLSKIPKRFLKPSQVRGVDTESFLKNQQLSMNIHENSVLGYRGLLGNPHLPPSDIVRAIMNRFSQNEIQRMASMENISPQRTFKGVANTILAHRQFMK